MNEAFKQRKEFLHDHALTLGIANITKSDCAINTVDALQIMPCIVATDAIFI